MKTQDFTPLPSDNEDFRRPHGSLNPQLHPAITRSPTLSMEASGEPGFLSLPDSNEVISFLPLLE
jgi:hypothetical protein